MPRAHNFYAGPAALPTAVLEEAKAELLDYQNTGVSIMETSHRSKEFDFVHNEAIRLFKELMGLDERYHVMLLHGGASLQFSMLPMNLLTPEKSADYILTGTWSQNAIKEAKLFGKTRIAATTEHDGIFTSIPKQKDLDLDPKAEYCHITTNNTIFGTQWRTMPNTGNVPLAADMSSDILSRKLDPKPFGFIYAGAQKNLGPSGLAIAAIRQDLLDKCRDGLATMLSYKTHVKHNSLFNTPPTFAIYLVYKVLTWLKNRGGVEAMEKENDAKANLLYGAIDNSNGFYRNNLPVEDRSQMNVIFRLPTEELEKKFDKEGTAAGFVGMKGHRSVGGIRISIYNAISLDGVKDVVAFMKNFASKNS